MIRFDCDWCRRTKHSDEIWILGLAAEAVGVTAARREITILPAWNRDTAVHPLAVHFCCEECKNDYMARLFDNQLVPTIVETTTVRERSRSSSSAGTKRRAPKHRSHKKNRAA